MFGVNLHQTRNYLIVSAKADPLLIRFWILVVMLMNAAATFYQINVDWMYSIDWFTWEVVQKTGPTNGNSTVLYSVIIM